MCLGVYNVLPGVETGRIRDHPFVRVGSGRRRPLVVVPGLNDPLQRATDSAWYAAQMAVYCRRFARDRSVYYASRPPGLPEDADTRTMARGYGRVLARVCDRHDHPRADAMGISMGGFLVTHLVADRPDLVGRAVLALAADRLAERGRSVVERWIGYAERRQWRSVYREAANVVARGWRRWALRGAATVYDRLSESDAPRDRDFAITARATLDHDAGDRLGGIDRPTLVVGGDGDPFFSLARFRSTAREVPDGRLARLRGASHEAVIQHPTTFEGPIRSFLRGTGT